MTYRPHIVLQWGGRLGTNSGEVWSNTIRFVTNGTDVSALQDLAAEWSSELIPALTTLMAAGGYSSAAHLDFIKANAVDAAGHQPNGPTNAWFAGDDFPAVAGADEPSYYQDALVVSFTTAIQRGLAVRGRCYVPTAHAGDTGFDANTGLISLAVCEAIRNAWAAFLIDLDDNPGPDFADLRAAVVSKVGDPETNWQTITGVRVGRVMDTQRRRRNALNENYTGIAPVS